MTRTKPDELQELRRFVRRMRRCAASVWTTEGLARACAYKVVSVGIDRLIWRRKRRAK